MVATAQYSGFYLLDPKPTNLRDVVDTIENINVYGDRTYKLKGTFEYEDIKDLSLMSWALRYRDKRLEADIISDLNREYVPGTPRFMPSEYLHKCWQYFSTMADNCEQAVAYEQEQDKKRRSDPSSITYRG